MFKKLAVLLLVFALVLQVIAPDIAFAYENIPTLPQTGAVIARTALIGIVLVSIGAIIIIIKNKNKKK